MTLVFCFSFSMPDFSSFLFSFECKTFPLKENFVFLYFIQKKSEWFNSILNEILEKNNRKPDRSCSAPVDALYLATNRTSRGARGLPNVCTTKGSTVFYLIYFDNNLNVFRNARSPNCIYFHITFLHTYST